MINTAILLVIAARHLVVTEFTLKAVHFFHPQYSQSLLKVMPSDSAIVGNLKFVHLYESECVLKT